VKYYVYIDWTNEDQPRPFYVGIGSAERTQSFKRNWSHYNVKKRFGIHRTIELETEDRAFLCEEEKRLTRVHHTYVDDPEYNGIGANLTPGGDHPGEMSSTTRRKMSESKMGDKNQNWHREFSEETRRRQREAAQNRPEITQETRKKQSERQKEVQNRPEMKELHRTLAKERATKQRLEWVAVHEKPLEKLDRDWNVVCSYPSLKVACEQTPISGSLLSQALNGHREFAKGFRWRFVKK